MKVGDRVRVIDSDYEHTDLASGQLGTVVVDGDHYAGVVMDNKHPHMFDEEDLVWNFYKEQLEVVE